MWKRIIYSLRLCMILSARKRADYCRRKKIFAKFGANGRYQLRKIPLYPELIRLGANVKIASDVKFVTHDIIYSVLNDMSANKSYSERKGCIEIGDNVFVGTGATILYDVKIGSNVIIAAGAVVNKDIPDNSVVGGVPCKVIGTFEDFVAKMETKREHMLTDSKELWEHFDKKHNK